ncbi:cytochrome-c peroxidase [Roseibium sp.]|uniref:cytochrome-c peroxidase n=1 Tax=Roseibium sp. TaxID=1936156 RepID=UPI003B50D096
MQRLALFLGISVVTALLCAETARTGGAQSYDTKAALGEALFFDVNLSKNRSQACATCHNPDYGFVDPRPTEAGLAVSIGDDGISLGDRNTPTASYAKYAPYFHKVEDGVYRGGQFLDGREPDLTGQAGGPPLNPGEMGMPDKASVVARLRENTNYVSAFKKLFGDDVFVDDDTAYKAMQISLAAFETTPFFSPFDSKYDRSLRGEVKLTDEEELGRVLFFSQQFTNCNQCHQLQTSQISKEETFSNYEYHNIGIPVNLEVRAANGLGSDFVDPGLLDNPLVSEPSELGKFKVPTLRNVAVTGPYMHNGVFKDLRTTVVFYNKYNSKAASAQTNPETGEPWAPPEVDGTLSLKELEHGPALDAQRIDALVAFMKTLTDRRYEHLLKE